MQLSRNSPAVAEFQLQLKGKAMIFFNKLVSGGFKFLERRGASIPITSRGGRRVDTKRVRSVDSSASTPCDIKNIKFSKRQGTSIPFACREDRRMDTGRGRSVNSSISTPRGIKILRDFATGNLLVILKIYREVWLSGWGGEVKIVKAWQRREKNIYHTGMGIPIPYPGPWRVGSGSKILYPGGYGSGSGSKFNYKGTGLVLGVP
ncbi:hypothetical protein M9H77_26169 [Catharanthus roseus]|uniref:Uncharacterized protein n=1 Tax=Catharanthus roseus TaxID=4058 RepID=A0ACC0ACZ2_CATRO|nr:hypothetical protein M9H77_26169 [Catharanthus roseus]